MAVMYIPPQYRRPTPSAMGLFAQSMQPMLNSVTQMMLGQAMQTKAEEQQFNRQLPISMLQAGYTQSPTGPIGWDYEQPGKPETALGEQQGMVRLSGKWWEKRKPEPQLFNVPGMSGKLLAYGDKVQYIQGEKGWTTKIAGKDSPYPKGTVYGVNAENEEKIYWSPKDVKWSTPQEGLDENGNPVFFRANNEGKVDILKGATPNPKKGMKIYDRDGNLLVDTSGGKSPELLTPPTTTQLQKETVGLMDQLQEMENLGASAFKDALTLQGKVKAKTLRLADWAKIDIGPENKEFLGRTRNFVEGIEQVFNKYRKEITGAQAAMKEIAMLRDSIINKKMTPTEFEYSFNRYVGQIKRQLRLKRMLLHEGLPADKIGKRLDQLYLSGDDVTPDEIDARGNELKAMNLSDTAVMQQLKKEGYY